MLTTAPPPSLIRYEAELVKAANKKLGLERAFNADQGAGGAVAGGADEPTADQGAQGAVAGGTDEPTADQGAQGAVAGGTDEPTADEPTADGALVGGGAAHGEKSYNGPPRDRAAIERMLRCGAQDIMLDDDSAFRQFSEADIDSLLQSSVTTSAATSASAGGGSSSFSKVAFIADGAQIDMGDPEFWAKVHASAHHGACRAGRAPTALHRMQVLTTAAAPRFPHRCCPPTWSSLARR